MFEKIKKFYDMRLYSKEQVYQFVVKNIITESQYSEICEGGRI